MKGTILGRYDSALAANQKTGCAMSSYSHLTLSEREQIANGRALGERWSAMARKLGRAPSTIIREVTRNALPKGGYRPAYAEGCYLERRQRPAILERDAKLCRFVHQRLVEGWTP